MRKLAFILVFVMLLCSCGANESAVSDDSLIQKVATLEEAVSAFLLEDNKDGYHPGECCGEGHLILGTEEKDGETVVYLLTMYGEYGFANDKFIKVSGSGVIPAVMILEKNEEGYKGKSVRYPDDGAYYEKSIKEMFPSQYHEATLETAHTFYDELDSQEKQYAREYLEKIGREAEVCDYADLDTRVLTSCGVPVETSNMLINHPDLAGYPLYVGKEERIESGERVVYEVSVDEAATEITYCKYSYDNPSDIKENFIFDKYGNKKE